MWERVIVDIVIDWCTRGGGVRSLTEQLQSFPNCSIMEEPRASAGNALTVFGYAGSSWVSTRTGYLHKVTRNNFLLGKAESEVGLKAKSIL